MRPDGGDGAWQRFAATRGRPLAEVAVAEVMSTPALTVRLSDTLWHLLERFLGEDLRHLVVVDDTGRCAGTVSNRGLAVSWPPDPAALRLRRVRDVVDGTAAVPADTPVTRAARLMWQSRLEALPVAARDGTVLGVLTGTDLAGLVAARATG